MDNIRNGVLILTGFGTILSLSIKWANNLILESVRSKLRVVPCIQNLFDTILKVMICILPITMIFVIINSVFREKDNFKNYSLLEILFLSIIVIATLLELLIAQDKISKIKKIYIDKLLYNKFDDLSRSDKKIIKVGIIFSALSGSVSTIYTIIGIASYISDFKITENVFISLGISAILAVFNMLLFIIFISTYTILKDLYKEGMYTIILRQGNYNIVCPLFLDIDEYYVFNENGRIRYVKQSEVTEIIVSNK
ncbi:hypothetical protein M4I33_11215 [Clostridium sp. LY3-2]|uniref:hypothetical protein n=1 Tax=Clostridium sp. LY3-2 TaxID=2942482 RepID=UPI002152CE2C|nr:hypothetical protein [Clostridium sp. LY3-2]MCR6515437.1 hypothetical protein [Clostridium sp. LY3-2]